MRKKRREIKSEVSGCKKTSAPKKLDNTRKNFLLNDKSVTEKIVTRLITDLKYL